MVSLVYLEIYRRILGLGSSELCALNLCGEASVCFTPYIVPSMLSL